MSHLKRSSFDVVQWLSNVRINISAVFLALSSSPLPHDLTMDAPGRKKKIRGSARSLKLTSHWLDLSHMAISPLKGVQEIECLTSPVSVVLAGVRGVIVFIVSAPEKAKQLFLKS